MNTGAKNYPNFPHDDCRGYILLIDDEDVVVDVAKQVLGRYGYHVTAAGSGREAADLMRYLADIQKRFDVIIMDISLPGELSGKKLVESLLEIDPDAAVIVSSGHTDDPLMYKFNDHGFCGKLIKPYRTGELIAVIEDAKNKLVSVAL